MRAGSDQVSRALSIAVVALLIAACGSSGTSPVPTSVEEHATTTTLGGEIAAAPAGVAGTREDPVPSGQIADIGGGWRLQVFDVVADATDVLADDEYHTTPLGKKPTLVTFALGYFGRDEPLGGLADRDILGLGSIQLDECGWEHEPGGGFSFDIWSGYVVVETRCVFTTDGDVRALRLTGSGSDNFDHDIYLEATPSPVSNPKLEPLKGPQEGSAHAAARLSPGAIGTTADLGEGWSMAVTGPASDITEAVVQAGNEPPDGGFRYVGVPLFVRHAGSDSSIYDTISTAVGASNRTYDRCYVGTYPGGHDPNDPIGDEGVNHLDCFVVPVDDDLASVLFISHFERVVNPRMTYLATS